MIPNRVYRYHYFFISLSPCLYATAVSLIGLVLGVNYARILFPEFDRWRMSDAQIDIS